MHVLHPLHWWPTVEAGVVPSWSDAWCPCSCHVAWDRACSYLLEKAKMTVFFMDVSFVYILHNGVHV